MSSEINILKAIHKHGGQASLKKLAEGAGFGIDYARYLLSELIKKKLVRTSRKGREWFELTARGKKQLSARALPVPKSVRKKRQKSLRSPRVKLIKESREEIMSTVPVEIPRVIFAHNLNEDAEDFQELGIGKTIEKASKALKGVRFLIASVKNKK